METIRSRVTAIIDRIQAAEARAGRQLGSARLLAATKSVPPEKIVEAVEAGVRLIGENRVQEAEAKRAALPADLELHMIGHLQTNKAKKAAELFACIESVDSVRVARAVADAAQRRGTVFPVLLEVNIGHEASKSGIGEDGLRSALEEIRAIAGIRVAGFMAIPPIGEPEQSRPYFHRLRELGRRHFGDRAHELSMGMSHDFEVAVEEGATIVRVGSAIFGERI